VSLVTLGIFTTLNQSMSYPIADSLFVSSQLFFFYGIIRATNATQIFEGFSYSWRRMFFRKGLEDLPGSFFEHKQNKDAQRKELNSYGNPGFTYLLSGIILFTISFNLYI
jgi:hypothetical protein